MRTIAIPSALDDVDYHEIQSRLSSWRPIKPKTAIAKVHNGLLLAVLLLGFGVIFISSSLWLVLGVGVAMSSYYGYTYWLMRDAQGIDPQQKRNLLFTFLFPFFITAFKVCFLSGALTSMMGALINMSQSR